MRISCPFCGERDSGEFTIAGDASIQRPHAAAPDAQQRFIAAVYMRNNPAGPHTELWYHGMGCRAWLHVARNTRTHEIFAVRFANETASA